MLNTANGNHGPEMASATREASMHRWIGLFAGLALTTVGAQVAHAEVSTDVALTSDYVWRGVSQTDQNPALQAGAEYAQAIGVYVGVWGSNVDFAEDVEDPARIEPDGAAVPLDRKKSWACRSPLTTSGRATPA